MRHHTLILLAALVTACSAQSPASAPSDARAGLLKYAQCMRSHGIANFPDPEGTQVGVKAQAGSDLDPKSQPFIAADAACRHFIPARQGDPAKLKAEALKFSACMRKNGYPDFPDPNADGTLDLKVQGMDSPQYKAAVQACEKEKQ
ncbi:hypothetical protein ACIBG8_22710 [Nonomuraea sp. NPDC050556]|uniref:hypothetical protein n=1 Tax=Nonomuraea sp. NPDC050556 TaxID=3364369 RepID=UPI0037AC25BF